VLVDFQNLETKMQSPDESNVLPFPALAGNLLATMTNMVFAGSVARFFALTKAQLTAWTDPLSALADRTSLL
jgi:hypothetical protein